MRKIATLAALCALTLVVPAQADKPPHPQKPIKNDAPAKPDQPNKPSKPDNDNPKHKSHPHKCVPRAEGYNASGTLVKAALTKRADGRYDGKLEVNVTRANHRAATGDQTFTLSDARVVFHHGVNPASPAAGSHVGLHGKITQESRSCTSFVPTITVDNVDIRTAKKA